MNIFKILASGDGTINEPNVSAFLGYLLNPKEDHGLRDEFLKRVIRDLINSNKNDLFLKENFLLNPTKKNIQKSTEISVDEIKSLTELNLGVEVFLEIAFIYKKDIPEISSPAIKNYFQDINTKENNQGKSRQKKTKQIVDIVVIVYKEKSDPLKKIGKEQKIHQTSEPLLVILIENKIDGEATKGQLICQYQYSNAVLKEEESLFNNIKDKIYTVYITPDEESFANEWDEYYVKEHPYIHKKDEICIEGKGTHLIWEFSNDEDGRKQNKSESVLDMLTNILKKESECRINPLQEYTKHTIRAFINFIRSGFAKTASKNRVTKESFYEFCLSQLRDQNHIQKLEKVQTKLEKIFNSENVKYSLGDNPMMTFYPKGKNIDFIMRVEVYPKHYFVVCFADIETFASITKFSKYDLKNKNGFKYKVLLEKVNPDEIEEFVKESFVK